MEFIKNEEKDPMQFVLAGYNNSMIYHDYDHKNNRLSAGKPLTVETAKSLFNFVNNIEGIQSYGFKDIIPKNILKFKTDEKFIIWQTDAKTKMIHYAKELSVTSGMYWVPKLVWKLEGNHLNLFAVKEDVVSSKDKLYQAPFFNINSMGSVCMGNAKFQDHGYDYEKIIKKVESGFWESVFTHSSHNELLLINFVDWCNNTELRESNSVDLLVQTKSIVKDIL